MRTIWIALLTLSCLSPAAATRTSDAAEPEPVVKKAGTEVSVAMHRHLALTDALRAAVVKGDLQAAREAGRVLSRQPPVSTAPADWAPWLLQVRTSAARVEDAWDLETAGRTAGEIGRACASCHRAEGRGPSFAKAESPAAEHGKLKSHMKHHAASMELMWEGLISGDDARYTLGAKALADSAYEEAAGAPELDDSVHALGAYGARVRGVAARADTYGALLATCARCHAEMRE